MTNNNSNRASSLDRKMNNATAVGLFALSAIIALAIVIEFLSNGRFAYWHIPTVAILYGMGRSMRVPSPRRYTAPTTQIREVRNTRPAITVIPVVEPANA